MHARFRFILPAAVAALLAPAAVADAATVYPSVSKIQPMNLAIGEKLTITGKGFVRGKNKNTVVFKRDKKRAVFAKAGSASTTKLSVVVPEKLRTYLAQKDGAAIPTKFRIRVLSKRFGKRYTALKSSPVIAPLSKSAATGGDAPATKDAPAGTGTTSSPAPPADCDGDGVIDDVDTDDDNDLMTDGFEASIGTDRCDKDTDGDGSWDVWEYRSALDLNQLALPYPGKRPYPNPLYPDADTDYDGDGMVGFQEHEMWQRYGNRNLPANYSDGTQTSDIPSGLTDDRRDVDSDGLPNWWEANGPMQPDWWTNIFTDELDYGVEYAGLDYLDPDSDGDGRLDGPDDIDHDGYTNAQELSRSAPLPDESDPSILLPRWVQPFNPCLPTPESITCSLHPPAPLDESWPPFKTLGYPVDPSIPRPLPASLAP